MHKNTYNSDKTTKNNKIDTKDCCKCQKNNIRKFKSDTICPYLYVLYKKR